MKPCHLDICACHLRFCLTDEHDTGSKRQRQIAFLVTSTAGPAGRFLELKSTSRPEEMELADFETSSWELVTSCKWRAHLLGAPLGLKFCDSGPLWFFFVWSGVYLMASHIAAFALGLALSGSARAAPLLCGPSVVGGNGDGARCGEPGGDFAPARHDRSQWGTAPWPRVRQDRSRVRQSLGARLRWDRVCLGSDKGTAGPGRESRGLVPGATALSTTAEGAGPRARRSGGPGFK